MQHNGEDGCFRCEKPGVTCKTGLGHNHVFPPETRYVLYYERMFVQPKTALDNNLSQFKGVRGPPIAALFPGFDIARYFVPDDMHAVAGLMRMLQSMSTDSKYSAEPY